MDTESHPRPRRARSDSAKVYDRERRDLELSEVLDVLQRYVDYGGGINCCVCGKLYKSRVCFIKHLWEHTVYWDLFAGDKNHMRVLSIQAALILYGTCQQPLCPIPVDNLLVTSPHSTENVADYKLSSADHGSFGEKSESFGKKHVSCTVSSKSVALSALEAEKVLPTTPVKKSIARKIPNTPRKKCVSSIIREAQKRRACPKLDIDDCPKVPSRAVRELPTEHDHLPNTPSPLMPHSPTSEFHTPQKQRIPFVVPKAPKKKKRTDICSRNGQVSRFLFPATETPEHQYWKETDSCACKRKRAE